MNLGKHILVYVRVCVCLYVCKLPFMSYGKVIDPYSRISIHSCSVTSQFFLSSKWHLLGEKSVYFYTNYEIAEFNILCFTDTNFNLWSPITELDLLEF